MRIRYGNSVEGTDYLPRVDIERRIVDTLMRGDSASLFGLRRIGKSSVMRAVSKRLESDRHVIAMDVQSIGHLGNFFKEYLKALARSGCGKEITEALNSAQTIPAIILDALLPWLRSKGKPAQGSPQQHDLSEYSVAIGRFIGDQINTLELERRPVLLLDEVVDLCDHAMKAGATPPQIESLLGQLTFWRKQGMPMLITGSIGMHSWVRRHNIDGNLLRDLNRFDLLPLSEGEASGMVSALATGAGLSWWREDMTGWLIGALPALYPAIIQYAMQHLQYECPPPGCDAAAIFDTLLRDRLMPEFETVFVGQFDERIKGYAPKVTPIRTLIRQVCEQAAPMPHGDFMAKLTKIVKTEADVFAAMLREDGFLTISRTQGVSPTSPLVRLWLGV